MFVTDGAKDMEAGFESQRPVAICGKLAGILLETCLRHTRTRTNRLTRHVLIGLGFTPAFVLGLGCHGDLSDIDRRVDRVLAQRSDQLAGKAGAGVAPTRGWEGGEGGETGSRRSVSSRDPRTVNPPPEELVFSPADEGRDYAAKLGVLQEQSARGEEMSLDLPGCWRLAQKSARDYLSREEDYILAGIRLLIERHRWSPRLFASSSLAFDSTQVDGDSTTAVGLVNQLGARQQLPFGGEVEARWVWNATENLRSRVTGQYVQSSRLALDGSIPLLRGAGDIAQEGLIQAERDLVYSARNFEAFRREFLVAIARDYFALVQQVDGLEATASQVEMLKTVLDRQQALYDAGRVNKFQVNLSENDLLSARASLANAREQLLLSLERFRVRLGLPEGTRVAVVKSQLEIPEPDVTLDAATEMALAYRLDLQNRRDQLDDTKRGVLNAANQLLPDLNVSGGVALPTDASEREGGAVYELDDVIYNAALTLEIPLDRENERLGLRQAYIGLAQAKRTFEEFRDNLVIDVRARVREIERARFNLALAEQRVEINKSRQEEIELKASEVDAQTQVDATNNLREARRARDQAQTDLRNSVLEYMLATATLRVQRDGTLEPLPGMERK